MTPARIQQHFLRAVLRDNATSRRVLRELLASRKSALAYTYVRNIIVIEREYLELYKRLRHVRRQGSLEMRTRVLERLSLPPRVPSDDTSIMRKALLKLVADMTAEIANEDSCVQDADDMEVARILSRVRECA